MRITHRAIAENSARGMQTNLSALAKLNEQISSGKSITKPSDSPTGTSTAMRSRADLTANDQYTANISTATSTLTAADSALGSMGSLLARVRDLVTAAANTGATSTGGNAAIATEIAGIKEGMIAVANRTVGGVPVFGGATSGTAAYDATGAYVGRTGLTQDVRVSPSETVQTSTAGPDAFGADGSNVFDLLSTIVGDLATNPSALSGRLAQIDTAAQRMSDARATVGVRTSRLEQVASINASQALTIKGTLSEAEDIDQAKTYLELTVRQTAYNAALQVTASTIQTSLVDYLR
ncbi:flagellar hook-associated protein 3 FlgL [Klenkia soli]|uniref:Flagellar hook-associated protein 3 FlgL n=1 Tax=Klenkia soli TaxID=1052260 RepID=A0A1H0CK79_9ACTN|nr:flagellar hook-associated protein FlgL [Klenkia soli]SDN58276.1 flagellar hook-associated protein 3 FlgL [Klenkia soli]